MRAIATSAVYLQSKGLRHIPETGILSVSVPGCVMGWWELHQRFGPLWCHELHQGVTCPGPRFLQKSFAATTTTNLTMGIS
jgi:gamma-glutamyltranspeptidase